MDVQLVEMIRNARKPYEQIGKPGNTAVILADTDTDPLIWQAFAAACRTLDIIPNVVIVPPFARDYENPPAPAQAAIRSADIVHYVTRVGQVHSPFGLSVSKLGKKKIVSEGITVEMFTKGAVTADLSEVSENARRINELWDKGEHVHVKSAKGTDFTVSIKGRGGFMGGKNMPKADFALGAGGGVVQFPGGECPIAPLEDTAEGVIVVDKTLHYPPGPLSEPVILTLRKGTITKIEGGDEADRFRRWLESYSDPGGWRLCELSTGTNPKAYWMGNMRQDRFVVGGCHVGFGMNADVGGTIESNIHYDVIFSRCTVTVDGKYMLDDGQLKV
jgi:leucyl aminopeptidase (aminopeptidase T)